MERRYKLWMKAHVNVYKQWYNVYKQFVTTIINAQNLGLFIILKILTQRSIFSPHITNLFFERHFQEQYFLHSEILTYKNDDCKKWLRVEFNYEKLIIIGQKKVNNYFKRSGILITNNFSRYIWYYKLNMYENEWKIFCHWFFLFCNFF